MKALALLPALALSLALLTAGHASAQPSCCSEAANDPNTQANIEAVVKQSEPVLNTLMEQIWNKQGELRALSSQAKPDAGRIESLSKEIEGLRAKLSAERMSLRQKIAEASPQGGPGYGPGYGRGYGPGACPGQSSAPNCCATPPAQAPAK